MAQLISLSIDLSKIDKTKIQTVDKNGQPFKNGARYYNVTISVNDEKNDFGQDVSCYDNQTKEQREAKEPRNYLGNGKVIWSGASKKSEGGTSEEPNTPKGDLPF